MHSFIIKYVDLNASLKGSYALILQQLISCIMYIKCIIVIFPLATQPRELDAKQQGIMPLSVLIYL